MHGGYSCNLNPLMSPQYVFHLFPLCAFSHFTFSFYHILNGKPDTFPPYHKSHDITHWYDLLEHVICLIRTLFKGREFSVFCLSMCVFVSYNFNGIPDMFVLQAEYFHKTFIKRLFPGTP